MTSVKRLFIRSIMSSNVSPHERPLYTLWFSLPCFLVCVLLVCWDCVEVLHYVLGTNVIWHALHQLRQSCPEQYKDVKHWECISLWQDKGISVPLWLSVVTDSHQLERCLVSVKFVLFSRCLMWCWCYLQWNALVLFCSVVLSSWWCSVHDDWGP